MWSSLILAGIGLWAGIDIVWAAAIYAMRELAHFGTSSSGVLTLFFLTQAMVWIIALPVGLFFGALGVLALRTRFFPAAMGEVAASVLLLVRACPGYLTHPSCSLSMGMDVQTVLI